MLSLILKILRDKVGELYNSINRKMQPLPFGDDQDYILDSDTVTVSDFWKDFKKYSQSPALIGVFYVFLLLNIIINLFIIIMSISNLSNHCLRNHENVYIDTSTVPDYYEEEYPWKTSVNIIEECYRKVGADKMMWASDYPGTLKKGTLNQLIRLVTEECKNIPESAKEKIMAENARRLFF